MDVEYGLHIPSAKNLELICLVLPHIIPLAMIPLRFPEFINKLKNRTYPHYFIFAVLSVGINHTKSTRTEEDKLLETKYARKSLELINKEKDISDPLIVWACTFICAYSCMVHDLKAHDQAINIATMSIKLTRLYQLDINKKTEKVRQEYTTSELEFRRRVWWAYYIVLSGNYIFNGNFITFEQRDIVVNLPTSDFKWRYGGSIEECNNKELKLMNIVANNQREIDLPQDNHRFIINSFALFKNIAVFVTKRWRKDHYNEDNTNLRVVLYSEKLQKHKADIEKMFKDNLPSIQDEYINHRGTVKLIIDTEHHVFNYILRQLNYSMTIYLYQSELVRDHATKIRPERIKAAKSKCAKAAMNQIKLLEWYHHNVPAYYQEFTTIIWTLSGAIVLTNLFSTKVEIEKAKYMNHFNRLISIYKSSEKYFEVLSSLSSYVYYIVEIKSKKKVQNEKLKHLHKHMEPFGIYDSDVEPWIIPKYGSFFNYNCCGKVNFSTLDIEKYLGENITVDNIFEESEYTDVYKEIRKSPDLQNDKDKKMYSEYIKNTSKTVIGYSNTKNITKSVIFDSDRNTTNFFEEFVFFMGKKAAETKESKIISPQSYNPTVFAKDDQKKAKDDTENTGSKGNTSSCISEIKPIKRKHSSMSLSYILNNKN
ncbi:hypothetical protein BB558_007201 [Smittium angustum]|uniref:Xylanolytic transcriptional activator regulatory domain-containing protein n=1 Tax=Smittium angustum TaxID=133377 RepID=A0A2U1IVP1_SMIAN|nr:hypothetical protein BB558_007201 [Smittium angustum]